MANQPARLRSETSILTRRFDQEMAYDYRAPRWAVDSLLARDTCEVYGHHWLPAINNTMACARCKLWESP